MRLQVAHLAHDQLDALEHMLAGLGDAFEALAVARKDLHAQFFFQFDDGLGHAGLRGVQGLGRFGQVQVAPHRFLDKAELMKIHTEFRLTMKFIMPADVYRIQSGSSAISASRFDHPRRLRRRLAAA